MTCQKVSYYLNENNICVRAGLHCNILAHTSLGTKDIGVVRASIDSYNTEEQVIKFINIIKNISKE